MKTIMNKLMLAASLAIVLLCSGSCSNDEHDFYSTLYGTVSDSRSGDPVNAASIILSPGSKTTVSGSDGHYEFTDLEVEQYTITVQKDGYATNRKTVSAVSGESVRADIPLTPVDE